MKGRDYYRHSKSQPKSRKQLDPQSKKKHYQQSEEHRFNARFFAKQLPLSRPVRDITWDDLSTETKIVLAIAVIGSVSLLTYYFMSTATANDAASKSFSPLVPYPSQRLKSPQAPTKSLISTTLADAPFHERQDAPRFYKNMPVRVLKTNEITNCFAVRSLRAKFCTIQGENTDQRANYLLYAVGDKQYFNGNICSSPAVDLKTMEFNRELLQLLEIHVPNQELFYEKDGQLYYYQKSWDPYKPTDLQRQRAELYTGFQWNDEYEAYGRTRPGISLRSIYDELRGYPYLAEFRRKVSEKGIAKLAIASIFLDLFNWYDRAGPIQSFGHYRNELIIFDITQGKISSRDVICGLQWQTNIMPIELRSHKIYFSRETLYWMKELLMNLINKPKPTVSAALDIPQDKFNEFLTRILKASKNTFNHAFLNNILKPDAKLNDMLHDELKRELALFCGVKRKPQ